MNTRLIFVYNADAGIVAGLLDTVHKFASPATYPCSLCAMTYGALAMDRRWRAYLKSLPFQVVFYHRPDFRAAYPAAAKWALPLVALERAAALTPILTAAELNALPVLDALMGELDARLQAATA